VVGALPEVEVAIKPAPVLLGSNAAGRVGNDRPGAAQAAHQEAMAVIVADLNAIEDSRDDSRATRAELNPVSAIVGHQRLRDQESACCIRRQDEADAGATMDDAVFDGQGCTGVELNSNRTDACALDGQAAYDDDIACPGVDRDACAAWGHGDAGAQHRA